MKRCLYVMLRCSDALGMGVILIICTLTFTGCVGSGPEGSAPFPVVHAKMLLLSARGFPPTWQVDPCEPACERAERPTHSIRSFGRVGIAGQVLQDVWTFSSNEAAHSEFQRLHEVEFVPLQPPNKTFEPPPEITY